MKFGKVPIDQATGAILAHSTRLPNRIFKKGHVLTADDIELMKDGQISDVTVARLEANDVQEDLAATRIANAVAGFNVEAGESFTGRCNLIAKADGLIAYEKSRLDELNLVDQSITVATLSPYSVVSSGQLIATIKIIPLAVPKNILEIAEVVARSGGPVISISPFENKKIGLIMSRLPGMKESILEKTFETAAGRVEAYGSRIVRELRVLHDQEEVNNGIEDLVGNCDILLIFGASAVVDRQDVLPAAVVSAGGVVNHFGMPVDPGNLLFIGDCRGTPVVGMPGCARSRNLNGFDWVLWRLLANIEVSPRDIMLMGGGGLLKEIGERGQLRQKVKGTSRKIQGREPNITALVLAAGSSRRMGNKNKLLIEVGGRPMLLHVIEAIRNSRIQSIILVTGHDAELIEQSVSDHMSITQTMSLVSVVH